MEARVSSASGLIQITIPAAEMNNKQKATGRPVAISVSREMDITTVIMPTLMSLMSYLLTWQEKQF